MATPEAPTEAGHPEAAWVTIARIQTTHGLRGELAAEILSDFPERFRPGLAVEVTSGPLRRPFTLESAWFHRVRNNPRVILKFQGLDTLSEAEPLRGWLVQVPHAQRHPLPPDRVYVSDLIGCTVLEQDATLGTVVGWEETGAVPLLRVESPAGEMLIPFASEICISVDREKKEIRVRTPEGLRELNTRSAPRPAGRTAAPSESRVGKVADDD